MREQIEALLSKYDSKTALECDGFTQVAHYVLRQASIEHEVYGGYVITPKGVVQPHFWIKVGEWVVDYRLRMWAGEDMPHGVFVPPADIEYHGNLINLSCNQLIFEILTGENS